MLKFYSLTNFGLKPKPLPTFAKTRCKQNGKYLCFWRRCHRSRGKGKGKRGFV